MELGKLVEFNPCDIQTALSILDMHRILFGDQPSIIQGGSPIGVREGLCSSCGKRIDKVRYFDIFTTKRNCKKFLKTFIFNKMAYQFDEKL